MLAGHDCTVLRDGVEAWEAARDGGADVVVADWDLPRLGGLELCRLLRGQRQRAHYTSVVLLTADGSADQARAGMEAGADDHLRHPLDEVELQLRLIAAARLTALHTALARREEQLHAANAELATAARRDPLTGLGNRLRLREAAERLRTVPGAVALVDVDHFKRFNDTGGHLAGDEALVAVAGVIADHADHDSLAFRFGGEEFLLLYPEVGAQAALVAVRRLLSAVAELAIPHPGLPAGSVLTMSAGVAAVDPWGGGLDAALRDADTALYRAKAEGRAVACLSSSPPAAALRTVR